MASVSLKLGRNATTAQKTAAFIAKARKVHGKRYDYSRVRYVDRTTPLRIVCPKHGAFSPKPENHLRTDSPSGCERCRREQKAKVAKAEAEVKGREFIARARKLHGKKYDYSRVRYVDVDTPVKVVCRKHGEFLPTPWSHTREKQPTGCPKCGDERGSRLLRERHKALFVSRAVKVHGNAYDYSKTIYKDARSKLTIVCPKHGPFRQQAFSHLRGVGCPVCGRLKAGLNVRNAAGKEFLAKARNVHGRKYRYDKTVYVRAAGIIIVTCPKHGDFKQSANGHLSGNGCRRCQADTLRDAFAYTKAEFVRKARKAHGRKFVYLGEYVNSRMPILIECKEHGRFRQAPISHLKGTGCPKCGIEAIKAYHSSNHEEFLKKARSIHGNKFSYPQRYERATKFIRITCPIHGAFTQTPNSHLNGHGCRKCQSQQAAERNRLTHEEFVQKALKVHGRKFQYPETYKASVEPLLILCPVHGRFRQAPNKHLNGQGCPRCMESFGERAVSRILERRRVRFVTQHKFADCIDKRPLRFDFWLPQKNALIEYDGPQHFEARGYYGGQDHFTATQRRDRIKTAYARKKKIRLIRVKYSVHDVEAFLVKKLGLR
jgi:ssDNA-binding Zn-finger/Zn-ribbon topoisomerase 1